VFPGEFESHEAMWMLWPVFEYKAGFPCTEPVSDMVAAMSGHTRVNLAVQDADDEAAAREFMASRGVPLGHVRFRHLAHDDIWARDIGPQFTRNRSGRLRATDWNFNMWGAEEPDSEFSVSSESFDRRAAAEVGVPVLNTRPGPQTGVRMVHEGGGVTHNGHGTMIAVESVVMQRNLGPDRFCGGQAPVTDYSQPNTYTSNPDWPACRALVEAEYRRLLGARKVIWIPTGIVEDNGTFRGALAPHIRVPRFEGVDIEHAGVYTVFTTNGHIDEVARFVAPDRVLLAKETAPTGPARTPAERLVRWIQEQNEERLERIYRILVRQTTESGRPIRIVRIPMPVPVLDVFQAGDGTYDYWAAYDRWEDGTTLPAAMLGVWAASYVNYVATNDLVLVSKFWKPGRPLEMWRRDREARDALAAAFPGREVVQVFSENVNRGGGGLNCITQQQPASAAFAEACGWAKARVGLTAVLYDAPVGGRPLGIVPRLDARGRDVYVRRLGALRGRVRVQVDGAGRTGWIDEQAVESAGERCPNVEAGG
jgi:agmatine deiminase